MDRIYAFFRQPRTDRNITRLRRRRRATAAIYANSQKLVTALLVAGYIWMCLIPASQLSQRTYIDENALQPAQVTTYWDWQDVHRADGYLYDLEGLRARNATSAERAQYIRDEFAKLGLAAATQDYAFTTSSGSVSGVNAYAVLSSPRTSGSEAMVISATWHSNIGAEPYNLRGVSIVLALAAFLKNYSLWAKDIVFVIGDGYLDGMQAWLNAYHGIIPPNLETRLLEHTSGVIWTALNIDYSGHSFSHLGVFFEGLNGRLPNQDLINSVRLISHYTGGVPFIVYDHLEPNEIPARWESKSIFAKAPNFIRRSPQLQAFEYRARNIARHVSYQARGRPSGPHGLYHRFRIDAITLYAVPAAGPNGFFSLGKIVESTLRTMNNLLERLHASFFFYLFTSPGTFMKIGKFLPSAVLVGVAMMFAGLRCWVDAGYVRELVTEDAKEKTDVDDKTDTPDVERVHERIQWRSRRRPVLPPLFAIILTHAMGFLAFRSICSPYFLQHQTIASSLLFGVLTAFPIIFMMLPSRPLDGAPFSVLVKSFNLCLASTAISIVSLLNFSLAATLAVTLGCPLLYSRASSSPSPSPSTRKVVALAGYSVYSFLAWGWLLFLPDQSRQSIWYWQVLGVWFAPFVCIVYAPLVTQAGIVALWQF